jgi:hypothetical protein
VIYYIYEKLFSVIIIFWRNLIMENHEYRVEEAASGKFNVIDGVNPIEEFDNYIDAAVRCTELNTGVSYEKYKEYRKRMKSELIEAV